MNKKSAYNNHSSLINFINKSIVSNIHDIRFSLDFLDTSLLTYSTSGQLVKGISKHLRLITQKKEKHCSNPIWHPLFKYRGYHSLEDIVAWLLTGKVKPLKNIDGIIRLPHPSPSNIRTLEAVLDKVNIDYWVSKMEPTFDIVTDKPENRDSLQMLLKQTMYLKHGRDSFKVGEKEVTNYINFRTSVKQTRLYQKSVTNAVTNYESLRFEFPIKRRKLFSEEIVKPSDILKYNMSLLEEIGFYEVDEIKLKRSRIDYDTYHYFSELIANFVNSRGFHAAQLWARRIKECPERCESREQESCSLMPSEIQVERDKRFLTIQECQHAKPIANFRFRYCREIKELNKLRYMMFEAFETWKKS